MRTKRVTIENGAGNETRHELCCYDEEGVTVIYTIKTKDPYMTVTDSMVAKKFNEESDFLQNCNLLFWHDKNSFQGKNGKPFQQFIITEEGAVPAPKFYNENEFKELTNITPLSD